MLRKLSPLLAGTLLWMLPIAVHAEEASPQEVITSKPASMTSEEEITIVSPETVEKPPFHAFTGKIVGNKVRLRTSCSLDGHVVRETKSGEIFAVVDEEKDFFAIEPPSGSKGYVFRAYILEGLVEAHRVNVRLSPDTESPIVGRLDVGDKIDGTVCLSHPKWLEIDLPNS